MKPTTAVIFAAGTGTRMLPITSVIQKEMLPILNRPVIDYIVSDLVTAGIKRVIFVIRPGQTSLKEFYLGNPGFQQALERQHKTASLAMLDAVHHQAIFEFVEQSPDAGYGTAIPLLTAMPLLDPNESVIVCGGDDFVWRADGGSEFADFIETFQASGAEGALMSLELPTVQLSQYGVLSIGNRAGFDYLTDLIEKPAAGSAPTNLVNISKYILNGNIREYVKAVKPRADNLESYITDAILDGSKQHPMVVHTVSGEYLDTGNPVNWLRANQTVAASLNRTKVL